jgi:predicted ATPase
MPHLLRVGRKSPGEDRAQSEFPFSLAAVRTLQSLELNVPVTFFVGENGSGKSTLLEGIAAAAELPSIGSSQVAQDDTLVAARRLGSALRLSWTQKSRKGFFLRAEDFFGSLRARAREDARLAREMGEALSGVRADLPRSVVVTGNHPDEHNAGRIIGHYDGRSHGESFMDVFAGRLRPGGLYLLDEPEAPLSPNRQLSLLAVLHDAVGTGAQFVIATHSPILLAYPGARIYSFDRTPVAEEKYGDLEHVTVVRDFLLDPERHLKHLR